MQFWKAFLVTAFLGFYFLSITPAHFYAHTVEQHHDDDANTTDDCAYVTLLELGQGIYFNPENVQISANTVFEVFYEADFGFEKTFYSTFNSYFFSLRAPPSLNFV